MSQSNTEIPTHYPVPLTPTQSPQIDFEAIGKELANDLAITILIQCLNDNNEKNRKGSARTQMNSLITCSEHIVTTGLITLLHERSVPLVNKKAATKQFERHIKFLVSQIK